MRKSSKRLAYEAILFLGVVSLFGDIVYEGCRGIIPEYLAFLGATAFIVGLVGGLGELIGYSMRLVSGYLADTTKAYWAFTFLGYGLIIVLPFLAFSNTWIIAALLIILERLGKALRTPSRDVILSVVGKEVGAGKTFGIHEFMDQIGATLGPALVASLMLLTNNNYKHTFLTLFIPFIAMMLFLFFVYRKIGRMTYRKLGVKMRSRKAKKYTIPKSFYLYVLAVTLNTLGLITAPLILYKASHFFNPWIVPIVYLLIQGVDAVAAILSGYSYDRFGIKFLIVPFILSIFPTLLIITGNTQLMVILAAIIFGIVFGAQESIYRAAVADLVPVPSRGGAYGLFNTFYGVSLLVSGSIFGFFLDIGGMEAIAIFYAIVLQFLALILLSFTKPKRA
ncbi:MFS transporter [Nanoarchaeota archaeon]|nr:MAG: MFS transporter [Nanoarchaeota archaeon]